MNQTEERTLRHNFSDQEIHDLAIKLATKNREATNVEEEKKAVTSEFKFKTDMLKAEINLLSTKIGNGYEMRDVECEVQYHVPEAGTKLLTRMDTGETWSERMTSEEWNLFNQSPAKSLQV